MNVVFRVDSSTQIGAGHLMRCLTLAQQLKEKGNADIIFICRDLEGNLSNLIKGEGFSIVLLPQVKTRSKLEGYAKWLTVPQVYDAYETINVLEKYKYIDYVVVDSYAIDETWEKMIRPYTGGIFVIDDLANRKHDCDLLLDQTYGIENADKYGGLIPSKCIQFLGAAYSLLKPEYRRLRQEINLVRDKIEKILIFFGGSDDTGETIKILEAITQEQSKRYHFIVIVGSSNPKKDIVKKYCNELANVEFHCQVNNMEHYISVSDIAFASAGVNTWERCVLGLPSIITVTADNQREIASKMKEKYAAVILGSYEKITSEDYGRALSNIDALDIVSLSENAAALMEKDGMYELLKAIGVNV